MTYSYLIKLNYRSTNDFQFGLNNWNVLKLLIKAEDHTFLRGNGEQLSDINEYEDLGSDPAIE